MIRELNFQGVPRYDGNEQTWYRFSVFIFVCLSVLRPNNRMKPMRVGRCVYFVEASDCCLSPFPHGLCGALGIKIGLMFYRVGWSGEVRD